MKIKYCIIVVGTALSLMALSTLSSCDKTEFITDANTPNSTILSKQNGPGPNPGSGEGFLIAIDSEKKGKKCIRVKRLCLCIQWPWEKAESMSELEMQRTSFMTFVGRDQNKLEMKFDYSLLNEDEMRFVERDLETITELYFPETKMLSNRQLREMGITQDILFIEGVYPISSWSRDEKTFNMTIDFVAIENQ